MTCIAVRVKKKNIEIAGDTQISWGGSKLQMWATDDKHSKVNGKLFQVNGMTIGCAGGTAEAGLLRIFAKTHKPKEMEKDSVLDWFIEFKNWAVDKAKMQWNDISIHGIIISDSKVFTFYDFMEVVEVNDFAAVGSGMWLALGAMELNADANKAVEIAIKYDKGCGGNVTKITINK